MGREWEGKEGGCALPYKDKGRINEDIIWLHP